MPVGPIGAWVALGIALRLLWVLAVPSRPVGDFALYRESAAYLVEHGSLDPEFIYMPGYVFLLAAVEWLGGGLLAAKLLGVAAGGVVAFAAAGTAERLFGRRAGVVTAALGALWPAGIAVTSVTGTDLPAGALVALAVWIMVRLGRTRPRVAAGLSGLVFGLGAWIRAVTVPLAALSFFFWWATAGWRTALRRTALTVAVAVAVLLPWGARNHALYGELFLTDSHGGHTALVGANPNSEGTYSRSLNLMFTKATGYRLMDTPERHRASDRAAYAIAKEWSAFEPMYAVGLLIAKADRLLSHERNLLYWPIFRQGVLPDSARAFEDAHRTALERLADWFWYGVVALFVAGLVLIPGGLSAREASADGRGARERDLRPLALLAFPGAMVAIYASFFSEVRYHLAIAPLLFPLAGAAAVWLWDGGRRRFEGERARLARVAVAVAGTFAAWSLLIAGGEALRSRHRWAVTICEYPLAGDAHLCAWRRSAPPNGPSPVVGAWDGVGLRVAAHETDGGGGVLAAARTELSLEKGRYRVKARATLPLEGGEPSLGAWVTLNGRVIANVLLSAEKTGIPVDGTFDHEGGRAVLEIALKSLGSASTNEPKTVWFRQVAVETFTPSDIIPRR
ncbi:MAG TPA: glycosyltransferase family 39 protein [Polyangia bacterium]